MIRRIIVNGFATYARLATTFAFGLIFTSYVTAKLGLEGFGLVSLAAGTFGVSFAIETGISFAVSRELAPAFASGDPRDIKAAFSSTFTASCLFGIIAAIVSVLLALACSKGVIRITGERPEFVRGLVWLLLAEGAIGLVRSVLSVYRRSAFASRLIWLDSVYLVIERMGKPLVAYLVLDSANSIAEGLALIPRLAIGNLIWVAASLVLSSLISILIVKQARVVPRWADFGALRSVLRRISEALQFTILSGFTPQILALVVNATVGLAYNGIWSVVVQVGGWCTLLGEGILRGIDPLMVHLRAEKGESEVKSVLPILTKVQAYGFIVISAVVLSCTPKLLHLWVGKSWAKDETLISLEITVEQAIETTSLLVCLKLLALLPRMIFSPIERTLFGFGKMNSYLVYAWFASLVAVIISGAGLYLSGWLGWAPVAILGANITTYVLGVFRSSISTPSLQINSTAYFLNPLLAVLLTWPLAVVCSRIQVNSGDTSSVFSTLWLLAYSLVVIAGLEWRGALELWRRSSLHKL